MNKREQTFNAGGRTFLLLVGLASVSLVGTQVWSAQVARRAPVRLAQAAPPTVNILRVYSKTEHWPMGARGRSLISFQLANWSSEDIRVNALTVYVSSTPYFANTTSSPTLRNFKLLNASSSAQYGASVYRASPGPDRFAHVDFTSLNLIIPRNRIVPLTVSTEVNGNVLLAYEASVHDGFFRQLFGQPSPLSAIGVTSGQSATLTGGSQDARSIVYAGVLRMGPHPTTPVGLTTPSSEQIIAKYYIWRDQPYALAPSIGGTAAFSFVSNQVLAAPRVLRLYRGSVNPLYLLGSVTVSPGELGGRNISMEGVRPFAVNTSPASPGTLMLTMDTTGAAPGSYLQANASYMEWTDTLTSRINIIDLPVAGGPLRY